MGKNVAMQVAAMSPAYLDEASVPAEVVKPDQLKREVEAAKDSMRKWLEDYKLKLRLRTRNTMDIGGDH